MLSIKKQEQKEIFKKMVVQQKDQAVTKRSYPGKELKCSDQWFMRFCRRYGAALRRETHAAQLIQNNWHQQ